MFPLKSTVVGLSGLMLMAAVPSRAQSPTDIEQLQAQLQAMQSKIQDLQKQIDQVATANVPPPAEQTGELTQRVAALEADSIKAAATLDILDNFEFHGYVRSGFGVNQSGGQQQKPLNPDGLGASLPGRLGNEPDTYGELIFKYHLPQATPDSIKFDFVANLMFQQNRDKATYLNISTNDANIGVREAYFTASNVLKASPDVTFWAGNRYYDRHDIHRTDYYWLDMSGYGGGVENIAFGPGKLAVAYLNGADQTTGSTSTGEDLTKQVFDIRYSALPVLGGEGTLWLSASYLNGGNAAGGPSTNYPEATSGVAVGWIQANTFGRHVTNTAALLYGLGSSSQFDTSVSGYVGAPRGALADSETLLFIDTLVWEPSDRFSVAADVVVQWNDLGYTPVGGSGSSRTYVALGARPVYMFTNTLGAALEVGYDYATDNRGTAGDDSPSLAKITFAPLIRPGGSFFARPEIRLYATYYVWNDFAPGSQINGASGSSTSSWNFGVQAEAWW